jgi:serine/threonine-protein kinase
MKHISGRNSKWEFKREIESLILLDHPNIVKIYGIIVNEKEKVCAMLLEYIEGKKFDIKREEKMEIKNTLIFKLIETIKYIHSKGIFHGDIKPSNIIITKNNNIKLIDFGGGISEKYNPTHDITSKSDLIACKILSEEIGIPSKMININNGII